MQRIPDDLVTTKLYNPKRQQPDDLVTTKLALLVIPISKNVLLVIHLHAAYGMRSVIDLVGGM